MNVILVIFAVLLVIVGLIGAIVPGIAGPPFSFLGLLAIAFVDGVEHSTAFLIVMGVLGLIIFVLDYLVPIWGTKTLGGTKAGVRGSTIGLILGLLITIVFPVSFIVVLLGPFFGAYIGEKIAGTDNRLAWRSAFGSFLGFLAGTFIKTIYAIVCIVYVIRGIIIWI